LGKGQLFSASRHDTTWGYDRSENMGTAPPPPFGISVLWGRAINVGSWSCRSNCLPTPTPACHIAGDICREKTRSGRWTTWRRAGTPRRKN